MTVVPCSSERRAAYVEAARGWIGTPYQHQASCKAAGTDCLGLLRGVWAEVRGHPAQRPPSYTSDWNEASGDEVLWRAACEHLIELDIAEIGAGDVLLFRMREQGPAKHLAIVGSAGRGTPPLERATIIHAYNGCGVIEHEIDDYWRRHIVAAFRFPEG